MVTFICNNCKHEGYEPQPEIVQLFCRKCKSKEVFVNSGLGEKE